MAIMQGLSSLLFPHGLKCPLCGSLAPRKVDPLCKNCRNELEETTKGLRTCYKCGRFISKGEHFCEECSGMRDFPFTIARSATLYEGKIKEQIHLFKYFAKRSLAQPFAELMLMVINKDRAFADIEGIVAVPLHTNRLQERSFNQAEDLALALAQRVKKTYINDAIWRVVDTPTQVTLNKTARNENLKNAFTISNPDAIKDKKLLLIDDIFTTGSTVTEITKLLLKSGAQDVSVMTLATGKALKG